MVCTQGSDLFDALSLAFDDTAEDAVTQKIAELQSTDSESVALNDEADDGVSTAEGKVRVNDVRRCESVVSEMDRRDAAEEKRAKKELTLIKVVKIKLSQLGDIKDIAKGSDLDVMLLSLDLGRDYSEVSGPNGISALLEGVEKKIQRQLDGFKADTAENRGHCVSLCSVQTAAADAAHARARQALDKAKLKKKEVADHLNLQKGKYSEMFKNYNAQKKEERRLNDVRAREQNLLRVLKNKLTRFNNIKEIDTTADIDKAEPAVGLRDWQNDVKEDGEMSSELAEVLVELDRKSPETAKIGYLLTSLENKLKKETEEGAAALKKLLSGLTNQRKTVEGLKVEVQLATRKAEVAKARTMRTAAKIQFLRRACRHFKPAHK